MSEKLEIKIDGKMKTKITNDWLTEFPSYKKILPQAWKKRVGPILLSIWYEMEKLHLRYKISACYFNLSNPSEFTYAVLKFKPKDFHCYKIKWERHEQGRYHKAADDLRQQAPIPLEGTVTLSQVINAYKNFRDIEYESDERYIEDPALIAAWAGKVELAKELLDWAKPYYEKNFNTPSRKPTEEWYQWMLEKISDPEKLRQTVEEQVVFHKLTKIPYEELIIDID